MFLKRSTKKEMMDDFSITDKRIDSALAELELINKYLGGISVSKKGIGKFYTPGNSNLNFKILDAGSGSSEILLKIREGFKEISICSLDKNQQACHYSKNKNSLNIICGDIFYLPLKKGYFDIVHASLLLHHFSIDELKEIFGNLLLLVKKGVVINELRRNIFALIGIKILTLFFSKSELVRNDAPLSVKKGFVKKELKNILAALPAAGYSIKRKWAFRWLVVVFK
ncbi:MAG TPA: methyltransferase domain-containing protein [Ignavibacteriaceae bacterium]|nr:methyltransferase domain-containing protein [Ignavibacteriaceae bacterium]